MRGTPFVIGSATALGAFALAAGAAQAVPGDLDPTFGSRGVAILDLPKPSLDFPSSAVLQPDGRILVGGSRGGRGAGTVFRVTPQGPLDRSFGGGDGFAEVVSRGAVGGLARQEDGRILAASSTGGPDELPQLSRLAAADGALDGTFGGGNGFVRLLIPGAAGQLPGVGGRFDDVAVQADGRIVAAGRAGQLGDAERDMLVVRFDALGNLDPGFAGGDGLARVDFPDTLDSGGAVVSIDAANAVALDPDGGIVVAGPAGSAAGVARLRPDGTPDPAFGARGDGTVSLALSGAEDLVVQPDGGILVPGATRVPGESPRPAVVRLRRDGAPDPSFGVAGVAALATSDAERLTAVLLQPDGKVVVAGFVGAVEVSDVVVMRLLPDGRPDPTFGVGGRTVIDAGEGETPRALLRQPDGRIVVVAERFTAHEVRDEFEILVARLQGDPPAPPTPTTPTTPLATPSPAPAPVSAPSAATAPAPATGGVAVVPPLCGGRRATIVGTTGADRLTGTPGPDVIAALAGNDTVAGLGGDDVVCGGTGDDTLGGGAGRDRLLGEAGRDALTGGKGTDTLLGGAGPDRLVGGAGVDVLTGGPGKDVQVQ